MDLTNEELKATKMLRDEYEFTLNDAELELVKLYRKFTPIEQTYILREIRAREYLANGGDNI